MIFTKYFSSCCHHKQLGKQDKIKNTETCITSQSQKPCAAKQLGREFCSRKCSETRNSRCIEKQLKSFASSSPHQSDCKKEVHMQLEIKSHSEFTKDLSHKWMKLITTTPGLITSNKTTTTFNNLNIISMAANITDISVDIRRQSITVAIKTLHKSLYWYCEGGPMNLPELKEENVKYKLPKLLAVFSLTMALMLPLIGCWHHEPIRTPTLGQCYQKVADLCTET